MLRNWALDPLPLLCHALSVLITFRVCLPSLTPESLSLILTSSDVLELAWMYSQRWINNIYEIYKLPLQPLVT